MVITESAVPSAQLLGIGSKLYASNMQHMLSKDAESFSSMPKSIKQKKGSFGRALREGLQVWNR